MENKIYLIGSSHGAISEGRIRLKEIYDSIRPEVVCTEQSKPEATLFNQFSKEIFDKYASKFGEKAMKKFLYKFALVKQGFEYLFNSHYARTNGVRHCLIDRFDMKNFYVTESDFEDLDRILANKEDLERILKERKDIGFEESLKRWSKLKPLELTEEFDDYFSSKCEKSPKCREDHLAKAIRDIYGSGKRMAAVVGAEHTLDSKKTLTLYSKIKDLNPERIILFE